jgi:hypothetical protein
MTPSTASAPSPVTAEAPAQDPKPIEPAGCCGGPAPEDESACCALDAQVKSTGGTGCGCASEPVAPNPSGSRPPSSCSTEEWSRCCSKPQTT